MRFLPAICLLVISLVPPRPALAAPASNPVDNPFVIATIAGPPDTVLTSFVDIGLASTTIRYSVTYTLPDHLFMLEWRDVHGGTLLATDGFCPQSLCGFSWDTAGLLGNTAYQQLTGQADFTGTSVTTQPCRALICPADYHEFTDREWGLNSDPRELQQNYTAASIIRRDNVAYDEEDPEAPPIVTANPVVQLGHTVELDGSGGALFGYTLTNLTDEPITFAIALLNWTGIAPPHSVAEHSVHALHGVASLERALVELDFGVGYRLRGPFEVLQPVPLPAPLFLLLPAALALLARPGTRRRAARGTATAGVEPMQQTAGFPVQ